MTKSTLLFSVFIFLSAPLGLAAFSTVTSPVPITHVYAPLGFDTSDNTEVIVRGYLPTLCYRAPNARAQVDGKTIQIEVTAFRSSQHLMCAQLAVPFLEVAEVGPLQQGDYGILVNSSQPNPRIASIRVVEATSESVDNSILANVSFVERIPGTRTVILKGSNPTNCYDLDEVKWKSNGKDTYSVLPLLKKVSKVSAKCEAKAAPFAYSWEVPRDLSGVERMPLLHVRIMNGKSVNFLFNEDE